MDKESFKTLNKVWGEYGKVCLILGMPRSGILFLAESFLKWPCLVVGWPKGENMANFELRALTRCW